MMDVPVREGNSETETQGQSLQAEEQPGLPATAGSWNRRGRVLPRKPSSGHGSADIPVLDFRPPEP